MNQQPAENRIPTTDLEPQTGALTPLTIARTRNTSQLDLDRALAEVRTRIAPLWPLEQFVAVNPFLGLTNQPFEQACSTLRRVTGADMLMPRAFYERLIEDGRITETDLRHALRDASGHPGAPKTLAELEDALAEAPSRAEPSTVTVADVLDRVSGSRTSSILVDEIAKWCAAYWDEGQAAWTMPWRYHMTPYAAWRAAARIDRSPDALGLRGFRQLVDALPDDPVETIQTVLEALGLTTHAVDEYLHRALFSIGGWVAYARYRGWRGELEGKTDDAIIGLLAIRLAWDYALYSLHEDRPFRTAWDQAKSAAYSEREASGVEREVLIDSVLQASFDAAFQRELLDKLMTERADAEIASARPKVQAAFCIDVRSEVFRRALETVTPDANTIGFAGFFGIPMEYVPFGHSHGSSQCPVLLSPKFVVRETLQGADEDEQAEVLGMRLLRRRAAKAWKSFKSSAVSSFVYVETAGLAFAVKLAADSAHITRTVTHHKADGLDRKIVRRMGPEAASGMLSGRPTGFSHEQRIATAEGMLKGMSLTRGFARLVMLAGHGSTTVNNPYAAGYDCGACGGNPGEANARVAATLLNDPEVRSALRDRGIAIPEDTWFLGCLHDTTTDEITIFEREQVPATHAAELLELETWLAEASAKARAERSSRLNVPRDRDVDAAIIERSRDWSEVRPEWGLAGNAAFIAAPRSRSRGVDLGGRVFLHDYDQHRDDDWSVLELILTAPVVVASWINLQYYGSVVDPDAFGSGNKVLHNVVGTLGVLEGNGGDVRTGLPWQAVHDGQRLIHEPLRLNVLVEAPREQIVKVLEKHESVRNLVEHEWICLFALGDEGRSCHRYAGQGQWAPVEHPGASRAS